MQERRAKCLALPRTRATAAALLRLLSSHRTISKPGRTLQTNRTSNDTPRECTEIPQLPLLQPKWLISSEAPLSGAPARHFWQTCHKSRLKPGGASAQCTRTGRLPGAPHTHGQEAALASSRGHPARTSGQQRERGRREPVGGGSRLWTRQGSCTSPCVGPPGTTAPPPRTPSH